MERRFAGRGRPVVSRAGGTKMQELIVDALQREISRLQREISLIGGDARLRGRLRELERTLEGRRRLLNRYLQRHPEPEAY
jgi:uncharacterized protein involved in exopolysaccharide biosynthesis